MNRMASTPISDQERRNISNTLALKAQDGDESVIGEIIRLNESLVHKMMQRMRINPDNEDAYMAGIEGLLHAINKFESEKGDYFKVAFYEVMEKMSIAINESRSGLGLSLKEHKEYLHYKKDTQALITTGLSLDVAIDRVASDYDVEPEDVRSLLESQNFIPDSFRFNGEECSLFDQISDDITPEVVYIQRQSHQVISRIMDEVLDERAQRIVEDYYGLGDAEISKTLQEIGNHYDISAERVRQILVQSQVRIRKRLQELSIHIGDFGLS